MKNFSFLLVFTFSFYNVFGQPNSKEIAFMGNIISINKIRNGYSYIADTIGNGENVMFLTRLVNPKFEMKYRVKKILHGYYDSDTIRFITYDHHGLPKFTEYNDVLLFLYHQDSSYVCVSNRYFKVFETEDNRWASDYSMGWANPFIKDAEISPKKIEFKDKVSFDLNEKDSIFISKHYPSPYYMIIGNKAIPRYGYYVDELLNIFSGKIPYKSQSKSKFMFFN